MNPKTPLFLKGPKREQRTTATSPSPTFLPSTLPNNMSTTSNQPCPSSPNKSRLSGSENIISRTTTPPFLLEINKPPQLINQVLTQKYSQVSDTGQLTTWVNQAITDNPSAVADYKTGKEASLQFLMGQVMKFSKGQAHPQQVIKLLQDN